MFIKSVVALAVASVAAAQASNFITFTNPVGDNNSYQVGQNISFSWTTTCVAPNTRISATPAKTEVQLLDATNSSSAFFIATVGYIDCSGASGAQGNPYWVVPDKADANKLFSLQIVTAPVAYSGRFKILPAGGVAPPPATSSGSTPPPKATGNAASSVAAPFLSAAALVASAAYMLL